MTTQTVNQPPRQTTQPPSAAQIRSIAGLLAAGVSVTALAAGLAAVLGCRPSAAAAVLELAGPVPAGLPVGPAVTATRASELIYRATYLANAVARVQAAVNSGTSLTDAVRAEATFARQHHHAQNNRIQAAAAVDAQARRSGPMVGWKATMDGRTSAECAAADGRNFLVTSRPGIGWPGSVHPHCRCRAVPPFAGAGMVDDVSAAAERRVAAA